MEIHEALRSALEAVIQVTGTGLVLTIGSPPMIRLDGAMRPVEGLATIAEPTMDAYLADLLDGSQGDDLERDRDVDFAFSYKADRFRGNAFYQRRLPAAPLRLIQNRTPTSDGTRLPTAAH